MTDPIGAPNSPLNVGVNGLYKNGQPGAGATLKGAFNTDGVVSPHYTLDAGYYLNGKRQYDCSVGVGVLFNLTDNFGLDVGGMGTLGFFKSKNTINSSTVSPEPNLTIETERQIIDPKKLFDAKGYADLRFKFGDKNPFIITGGVVAGEFNITKGTKTKFAQFDGSETSDTGEVTERHTSTIMNPENTNKYAIGPHLGIEKSFGNVYVGANAEYLPQLKNNQINAGVTLGLRF